jgi:hypothetical protein
MSVKSRLQALERQIAAQTAPSDHNIDADKLRASIMRRFDRIAASLAAGGEPDSVAAHLVKRIYFGSDEDRTAAIAELRARAQAHNQS